MSGLSRRIQLETCNGTRPTEQQATNTRELSKAVESVNGVTQEAASSAEEVSGATHELSSLAKQARGLVEGLIKGRKEAVLEEFPAPVAKSA